MSNQDAKTPELVEQNLQILLKDCGLAKKLTVAEIKDWVFNADGESVTDASNRFHQKWLKLFQDKIEGVNETNWVIEFFVDAWNYFPHKSLGGKSPFELVQELKRRKILKPKD